MKLIALFFLSIMALAAIDPDVVRHPAPREPKYISAKFYDVLKNQVAEPPLKGSLAQAADERTLFELQASRKPSDCSRAKDEVKVSLDSFFRAPVGPLAPEITRPLTPLFEQIRNDGDYFVQKLKRDFPRQRPFQYLKGIHPCVPHEVTESYPSGHAVLSSLFARVLTDLYPHQRAALEARSKQIGDDRVLVGMHHPSDVETGRKLGDLIYAQLNLSTQFQNDLKSATPPPLP
ncbi:MAG: phosphatase PAP2 family protein [Deltaproteobacteria bacterium]|nr:phosphatase PAP2 family protein [Deltaproteobacteria bacterium]MBI3295625.1 phosphatase PAP2 family protein [Deltaproteobacteria bacterium]